MTDVKALEALFECQDQVIIFSDENGHVTCVNDFARLLLKRKPTDITGKPLWHLFSEDELHATVPVLKKMMQQAARRGKAKELIMLQAEEGLPIFFDCIIRPFFAQPAMLAGYLCRLTDVTLFENEKNELLDNLTRHELVTKASQEGLWDWMVKEDKVYFSPKFKELMGYPPSTYIDGMNALLTVLHPDDVERTVAALQAHLQERKPFLIDYRLKTISQSYRWFRVYGQAIWNEEGEAIRMAGSVVDVHESKLQQEEIATANSLLHAIRKCCSKPLKDYRLPSCRCQIMYLS